MEEQVTNGRLGTLALHGVSALTGGIPLEAAISCERSSQRRRPPKSRSDLLSKSRSDLLSNQRSLTIVSGSASC